MARLSGQPALFHGLVSALPAKGEAFRQTSGDRLAVSFPHSLISCWPYRAFLSACTAVLDTSNGSTVGSLNLGGDGANSGDGMGPTGIVLTSTPTPTGS